jgi:hypothetical protein
VDLVRQTLETITEYCQGPCHENQVGGTKNCASLEVIWNHTLVMWCVCLKLVNLNYIMYHKDFLFV